MTEPIRRPPLGLFPDRPQPRLYDRTVEVLRVHHYSKKTEEAYCHWIRKYTAFHAPTHPRQLAEEGVNRFLTHLAVNEHVAASTQNQAMAAVLFLYQHVLEQPLDRIEGVVRARRSRRLPSVLTVDEVQRIMPHFTGDRWLIATLLYGGGLRLTVALKQFRDQCTQGWTIEGTAKQKQPDQVWIDSGYMAEVVYAFSRHEPNFRYRPAIGRGAAQQHRQWYNRPTQTGSIVKHLGEGFHINLLPAERLYLVEVDADHWKTWVHARLSTPIGQEGAMTIFEASPAEHLSLTKHLTAERKVEEFVAGRGTIVRWERLRRQNHWFDALYNTCAAGSFCGVRLVIEPAPPPRPPAGPPKPFLRPDGRPWIDSERWLKSFRAHCRE